MWSIFHSIKQWWCNCKQAQANAEIVERLKIRYQQVEGNLTVSEKFNCYGDAIEACKELDIIDYALTGKNGSHTYNYIKDHHR